MPRAPVPLMITTLPFYTRPTSKDIVIGYRFTEVTWIDSSGGLKVDFNMANVVRGQKGGGGEPL